MSEPRTRRQSETTASATTMRDTFNTVSGESSAEIKVKGSRFLALAMPVRDDEAAERAIAEVRRREYAATHHCSAFRIGPDGGVFRYNDDGEPSGTAGAPILRQIDALDLTDTLVVVTRYYGGTKLGTGGLIRAYGDAAAQALAAAHIDTQTLRRLVTLRFGYDDTSPAMHTIGEFDAEIRATRYSDVTEIDVAVRLLQTETFAAAFVNALGGRGTIKER